MQPLTAAVPFQPEGAALLGGCRPAVWTAGRSESALCPLCFFCLQRKHLKGATCRRRSRELLLGFNGGSGQILQSAPGRRTKVPPPPPPQFQALI